MDAETGRSRGTGFACFWDKADADKVVEQSELLRVETTGGDTVSAIQLFSYSSAKLKTKLKSSLLRGTHSHSHLFSLLILPRRLRRASSCMAGRLMSSVLLQGTKLES
jgi:RNA recognition motif-containing protein